MSLSPTALYRKPCHVVSTSLVCCYFGLLLITGELGLATSPQAAILHVAQGNGADDRNPGTLQLPLRSIGGAVAKAGPGDHVLIHSGVYRETVRVSTIATEQAPLVIEGMPHENVIISGADLVPADRWTAAGNSGLWQYSGWNYRGVPDSQFMSHPSDERHRLIGRTEQVIVDGKLLHQVLELAQMKADTFFADPLGAHALFVFLLDSQSPSDLTIEVSVRPVLMDILGDWIEVKNLHFRYASNQAQQAALHTAGSHNIVEDCLVDWTNGVGAGLDGANNLNKRIASRFNGQMGMNGHGDHNRLEECLLTDNNWKGFAKAWECGGIKVTNSDQFEITNSVAAHNNGPGFWFDIDDRDGRILDSLALDNAGPGIFVEISERILVQNNVCAGNGLEDEPGAWQYAGILMGEAIQSDVSHNVSIGNRTGIEVRQQRVRTVEADAPQGRPESKRFDSTGLSFHHNIVACNHDWQFAFYGPGPLRALSVLATQSPVQFDLPSIRLEQNLDYAGAAQGLILWKWLSENSFQDLDAFRRQMHLENGSRLRSPRFENLQDGVLTLIPGSPGFDIGAGLSEPSSTLAYLRNSPVLERLKECLRSAD